VSILKYAANRVSRAALLTEAINNLADPAGATVARQHVQTMAMQYGNAIKNNAVRK
jgi:hypothetical protein